MGDQFRISERGGIDVEGLLQLAREKSVVGRQSLVNALGDLFEESEEEISAGEREIMHGILQRLVADTERQVRQAVSERFADTDYLPGDIAYQLATDDIEVAFPILLKSELLRDLDLIEIIRNRTFEHQLAISQRQVVSEAVSDVLVETDRESVILGLLGNAGAKISRATLERLVEESKTISPYQEPLMNRSDLDGDLAKRMFVWVSAALRGHIISRYKIDREEADDLLAEISVAVQDAPPQDNAPSPAEQLAAELKENGAITPDLMANSLRDGEVRLFEAMLKEATGLRKRLVERILFESGGEGLAIALKSLNCPQDAFEQMFIMSRRARRIGESIIKRESQNLKNFYPKITQAAAEKVVARWRRNAGYLAAIRDIEL